MNRGPARLSSPTIEIALWETLAARHDHGRAIAGPSFKRSSGNVCGNPHRFFHTIRQGDTG
jgi:hypothetical protein